MAQISESHVTLRIVGDDLLPDEISKQLGAEASKAEYKGQEIVAPTSGRVRIAKTGSWRLHAPMRQPEDLDGQIEDLLSQLTKDMAVWSDLSDRFDIMLFVGLMMTETNEGCAISASSLEKLGARGIELGLDVYAPLCDE